MSGAGGGEPGREAGRLLGLLGARVPEDARVRVIARVPAWCQGEWLRKGKKWRVVRTEDGEGSGEGVDGVVGAGVGVVVEGLDPPPHHRLHRALPLRDLHPQLHSILCSPPPLPTMKMIPEDRFSFSMTTWRTIDWTTMPVWPLGDGAGGACETGPCPLWRWGSGQRTGNHPTDLISLIPHTVPNHSLPTCPSCPTPSLILTLSPDQAPSFQSDYQEAVERERKTDPSFQV